MAKNLFRNGTFNFVGVLGFGEAPLSTKQMGSSDWNRTKLGVSVRNGSNSQFLALEYIHSDKVKTTKIMTKELDENGKNKSIEVQLSDTYKPEIVGQAADFIKIVIDLEQDFEKKKEYTSLLFKIRNHEMKEEKTQEDLDKIKEYSEQVKELANNRVEFCHMQDVIKYLNAMLPSLKGKKVRVTGQVKSNYYNGTNRLQYIPSFIELVPEDTENQLKVILDFFFNKEGIDDDTKSKKMYVNGYVGEKIKKADKLIPLQVVVDYTKINEEDEQHKMMLDFMKGIFKIKDKKQVHKIGLIINAVNGAETVEFSEDCLTDLQRMAILVGKNKLEDFKPRGNTYGERIQELRVINADFKNYNEGAVEVFETEDLLRYLVNSDDDKDVRESEVKKEENNTEEKTATSTDMMFAQLFG